MYAIKGSILGLDIENIVSNKGNSVQKKGLEFVALTKTVKAIEATYHRAEQINSKMLSLLPKENKRGNNLKVNDVELAII